MGTPLGPKYIPYTYMDPLGYSASLEVNGRQGEREVVATGDQSVAEAVLLATQLDVDMYPLDIRVLHNTPKTLDPKALSTLNPKTLPTLGKSEALRIAHLFFGSSVHRADMSLLPFCAP